MGRKTLIAAVAAALIAAAYYYNKGSRRPVAVQAYTVAAGEVRATVSNTRVGTVKACRRAYLAPAAGGQVAALHVKEGDRVKKNQILLEVWNRDLKAQVAL
ncbi:MAG: efflux RND transporter periplasmic adaptor subunit, partial [Gammaproteobacteria bacterium]